MKDLECRYLRFRGDGSPTAQSGLKPVNSADGRQPSAAPLRSLIDFAS
jgi:hypothetical protein